LLRESNATSSALNHHADLRGPIPAVGTTEVDFTKTMKIRNLFISLALASSLESNLLAQTSSNPAPDPLALTIAGAIQEAIDRNLSILAERANLPVSEAAKITASLRPNPVVSAAADHLDALGTGFSEANAAGPPEYSLRVDLPIERAKKRELRVEAASFGRRIAEHQLENAIRKLRLEVQLACIDVLEAKAKLTLAKENLTALERLVQLNEARLASGAIAPLEVSRARVAMLQYRTSVRSSELELATAKARLLPLLGRRASGQSIDILGELAIAAPSTPLTLEGLLSVAITARPDYALQQREQARTQADLRLQIAQGKIDYSVGMEYRRQQGLNGRGNMIGFFVSAPVPVFNRNQGEIARAQAEGERARRAIRAVENEIQSEVFALFQEYESARSLVADIEKELLTTAEQARKTTAYVYNAGATTLVDVLDAQRAFNETMQTYHSARANFARVQVRLAAAAGKENL
jgi:outer membrane protein, heavy metal efflux system